MIEIEVEENLEKNSNVHIFKPNPERTYYLDNLLTIENETSIKTLRISEWLHEDPKALDITRRRHNMKINREIFDILVSKLRANHPEYFRDALGLNATIEFKGYDRPVKAIIPYKNNPIEFYKWWCINQDHVHLTFAEKIILFDKVLTLDQNAIKIEHKNLITRK